MKTIAKFLKILVLVAAGLVVLIAAMVGLDLIVAVILTRLGGMLNLPWLGEISGTWFVLIAVLLMPKGWIWKRLGWDKPYVCHATDVIRAPVAQVWDLYRLRPRTDYHSVTMPTVVSVEGTTDEFLLMVDDRLTKDGDIPPAVHMKVDELIEDFYIRMHCKNASDLPLFGKLLVNTEIWMDDLGDGTTRVTYAENLSRMTLGTFLAFLFLNPAKDGLKQVKSRCEGTEDTSWMTKSMNNLGPNGEASAETNQTMTMVMIATTLVLGGMVYGILRLILSMAP